MEPLGNLLENCIFYIGIGIIILFFLDCLENHRLYSHDLPLPLVVIISLLVLFIGLGKLFPFKEEKNNSKN